MVTCRTFSVGLNNLKRLPVVVLPIVLSALATALRLWIIRYSDLPAGDEINSYIFNAQKFSLHSSLPGLDNFPFTAVVYGVLIRLIDQWTVTLSGVVARDIVVVVVGAVGTYLVYEGVKKLSGMKTGAWTAAFIACFPGTLLVFRADISLYYVLMPLLSLSLINLAMKPLFRRAIIPGIIGALFYMSRSDGLFIFILSICIFTFYYKKLWKMSVIAVLAFVFTMSCFWAYEYHKDGHFSGGAGNRAIAAFYQAEGLIDNKGGDWHDFTDRGLARFGPQEQYGGSFFALAVSNLDAIQERVAKNLRVIGNYCNRISIPAWCLGFLVLASFLGNYRKTALLFAGPCLLTSCIYLAFYYQTSYFTILSYGLAIGVALGIATVFEIVFVYIRFGREKRKLCETVLFLSIVAFFVHNVHLLYPQRRTSAERYWGALTFIKSRCPQTSSNCFFTPPYKGSKSMPIFVNRPFATIDYGPLEAKQISDQRPFLLQNGFKYLLCSKEFQNLWTPGPDGEDIVYINGGNDVKVVSLDLQKEFNESATSYFRISSSENTTALIPAQEIRMVKERDALIVETSGSDAFVFLPSVRTAHSSIIALKIRIWSPFKTPLKIYFKSDSQQGFHEQRSSEKIIRSGINTIYFSLPVGNMNNVHLRMDPGNAAGRFKLYFIEARAI